MGEMQAKVQISLKDGILEIEGSEEFVSEQLTVLRPLIENVFKNTPLTHYNSAGAQNTSPTDKKLISAQGIQAYENLFAEADEKIQILKSLPGSNKAVKAVNGALLLAFANTLMGNEATPYSDVRDLCKSHACLDSGNFSSTMKTQKELFLITGSGAGQSIRLTVPGKKKAEELAKHLN